GAFFGLLGPNGAGKTTLIGVLAGLVRADSGEAEVLGHNALGGSMEFKRELGIVPQELVYDPFFNVREALVFQSKYFGLHKNGDWIDYLLDTLDLRDKAQTNTRQLSGGMKRRLMIAQALVHRPPVIVLDEPTAGVDINLRLTLWEFIRGLNAEGRTIILTTHYLEEAEALCGEVALMNGGRIAARGKTAELIADFNKHIEVRLKVSGGDLSRLPPHREAGGFLAFSVDDCDAVAPLLAAVADAGCALSDLKVSRADLADAFVSLVGGK
ncbi:MAG: ABC transporter ATP-binding protein, partial [Betaproteobacteria bacterium]|nr:ABC transporter ATP-binding protein [Betaproteobacteria bacterium]